MDAGLGSVGVGTSLGGVGIGAVWGWLAVQLLAGAPNHRRAWVAIGVATALAGLGTWWADSWPAAAIFGGGALVSAAARLAWEGALRAAIVHTHRPWSGGRVEKGDPRP